MSRRSGMWLAAVGAIALGGLAALGWYTFRGDRINAAPIPAPTQAVLDTQRAFVNVAQAVRPAVVSIQSVIQETGPAMDQMGPMGPMGPTGPMEGAPGMVAPMPRTAVGTGSGFIVRPDGWIVTNDHVVADASRVTVRLDDGRQFTGDVVRDYRSDIAVVKIPASNLPVLNMGDSSKVEVGQYAIAFGSPFGLRRTMTVGVVSALGRESVIGDAPSDTRYYPDLMQTDASINPGNSGGPLLDINGSVIGVAAAIGSPNGGNVGIGFAIPSNEARFVVDQLITKGSVTRGFLGFVPENLTPDAQARYGVQQGALVAQVQDGSPAAKSGLQVEDVITRFNNQPVTDELSLRDAVSRATPGQTVPVTVMRGGKQLTLNATIGTAPAAQQVGQAPAGAGGGAKPQLGVRVADLTPAIDKQIGLPAGTTGVVVASVDPGSAAAEAGIAPGDVILKMNGQDVTKASQLPQMLAAAPAGSSVSLVVRRQNTRMLMRATPR